MHSAPLLSPTQGAIDCGCHSGAYGMGADSYGMGADFLDSFVSGLGDAFSKEAGAAAAKALVGAGTNALLSSILPKKPKAPAASTEVQQLPQPQYQPQYQPPPQPQYQPPPQPLYQPPPIPKQPPPKNYTVPIAIGAGALVLVGIGVYALKKK